MAKVYYVKDGSSPQNLADPLGRDIALAELERRLQGRDLHDLGTLPPEFNPHRPAHEARHVVLELDMDEPRGQRLTRTGQTGPEDCGSSSVLVTWGLSRGW